MTRLAPFTRSPHSSCYIFNAAPHTHPRYLSTLLPVVKSNLARNSSGISFLDDFSHKMALYMPRTSSSNPPFALASRATRRLPFATQIRTLSATAYVMPPIRSSTANCTKRSDTRTLFTNASGQSLITMAPRYIITKTPSTVASTRQIAITAMPCVAFNTAHSAAPPAPGADFNVLMIGAGVSWRRKPASRFLMDN